ncbi:MAG TPA: DUF192 domain-containing protein [Candidatus Angelobacter sp.]|nr:DUF192 domain-containing protein [Candidatus Angelobacter sp.]
MRFGWKIGLALAAGLFLTSCEKRAPSAQPKLSTLKLWLGPRELTAEVAQTLVQIQTGMMFRTNINEGEGMIFILPYPQQAAFWMKNCVVPLSVAYIDPDGIIQEIHDLQPGNTNTVFSASENIRYALETRQGWFDRNMISTGVVVRTERGSLTETFLGRR